MNFPIVIQINAVYKISTSELSLVKVEILWEGHNFGKNLPLVWQNSRFNSVASKQVGDFFQIFVAFSEKLNFSIGACTRKFEVIT